MSTARDQAVAWVDSVWGERSGYFFFAFGVGGHVNAKDAYAFEHWHERSGHWPDDRDRFLAEAIERAERDDVYVAPYLREGASRKKGNALPSAWLYSDLDEPVALPRTAGGVLLLGPSGLLVDSGRGRHLYLRLPEELEPNQLEGLNRYLAHELRADAGWAENKVLRLPGTWNHKGRAQGVQSSLVSFLDFRPALRDWSACELVELLGPAPTDVTDNTAASIVPKMPETTPAHLLARLTEEADDRSKQSYAFIGACLERGLSDGETLALALEHHPTREKYGDRADAEIRRAIRKLRATSETSENAFRGPRDSAPRKANLLPFTTLSSALAHVSDEPAWVWRDYIAPGAITLFAGRPKVGKSTLLFGLFAALVRGWPFLGLETRETGILLLSEEPLEALRQKASRFGLDLSFRGDESLRSRNERIHLLRRGQVLGATWADVVERAVEYAHENELGLLVVDTFDKWTGVRGDDENKAGAQLGAIEPLAAAAAENLAALISTHHRKSGGKYGEGVRGANALVGAADIVLEIERLPATLDESRKGRLLSGMSRFEDPPDLVVELGVDGYAVLGDPEQLQEKQKRDELLAVLDTEWATTGEVSSALGIAEGTARGRLHEAHRHGDVEREGTGKKNDPFRWRATVA
jgi:hypothetical protein